VRIREYWRGRHITWDAVDVDEVTADIYEERYQCRIGDFQETGYDLILCLSTLEHCAECGDTLDAAMQALHHALSGKGIMVLTVPVGIPLDIGPYLRQFDAADLSLRLSQRFGVLDERFWLWDGDNYENVGMGETANAMYGITNETVYAAAVGAWVLARKDANGLMREEKAAGCCRADCECATPDEGRWTATPTLPEVRAVDCCAETGGEVPDLQRGRSICDGGG
jgi:hypothetical protein